MRIDSPRFAFNERQSAVRPPFVCHMRAVSAHLKAAAKREPERLGQDSPGQASAASAAPGNGCRDPLHAEGVRLTCGTCRTLSACEIRWTPCAGRRSRRSLAPRLTCHAPSVRSRKAGFWGQPHGPNRSLGGSTTPRSRCMAPGVHGPWRAHGLAPGAWPLACVALACAALLCGDAVLKISDKAGPMVYPARNWVSPCSPLLSRQFPPLILPKTPFCNGN
jgi:hypothetical protein